MKTLDISAIIRRSVRRIMFLAFLTMLLPIAIIIIFQNYFTNLANGPYTISTDELLTINRPADTSKEWVTITGSNSFDTGYALYESSNGGSEHITAYLVALQIEDRLLFVLTSDEPTRNIPRQYQGRLTTIDSDMRRNVLSAIEDESPELATQFLPYMLNSKDDYRLGGFAMLGFVVFLVVLYIGIFVWWLRIQTDESNHGILRKLSGYGDPQTTARQIETEFEMGLVASTKKIFITRNWFVYKTGYTLEAIPLKDIMWAYVKISRHMNGVIIHDRNNKQVAIPAGNNQRKEILTLLLAHAPWGLYGYSNDIKKLWDQDRLGFTIQVDQRRHTVKANRE